MGTKSVEAGDLDSNSQALTLVRIADSSSADNLLSFYVSLKLHKLGILGVGIEGES